MLSLECKSLVYIWNNFGHLVKADTCSCIDRGTADVADFKRGAPASPCLYLSESEMKEEHFIRLG